MTTRVRSLYTFLSIIYTVTDVNAEKSVIEARKQTEEILGSDGLNVLINNAAIYLKCSSIQDISEDAMMQSYRANVVGPALMCRVS